MYSKLLGGVLLPLCLLAGCASYQTKLGKARHLIEKHEASKAAEELKPKAMEPGDDQVVYLFEYGTAQQIAKEYKMSNEALLMAEELTEIKDYHSLSRITGSLLLNEGLVQYKGEDYEKVLINAILAVNFLMLGDTEAAMVETRKLNDKLYRYRFEAKRDYEQNPFAFYLAAMIREQDRDWDGAYIDYERVFKLNPNVGYLKTDLIRAAQNARRSSEVRKWKKKFPEAKVNGKWKDKNFGELILIYQQGWAPRKKPHPDFPRVPKLYPVSSLTEKARLVVNGEIKEESQQIHSVEDVAIKTLDDAYAGLIAKRVGGIAAKAVVSDQIRQKNKLLGDLAWIGMNIADRADLRQWLTLPETLQVAKVYLPAGKHKVKVVGLSSSGSQTGEEMKEIEVEIKPRKKTFINWRSVK